MFTQKPGPLAEKSEAPDEKRMIELLEKLDCADDLEEKELLFNELWLMMQP